MKWIISSDHAAVTYKKKIQSFLESKGFECLIAGAIDEESSCDYPDIVDDALSFYKDGDMLVFVCGTGIGVSIRANRYTGIRAAVVYDTFVAEAAKAHNDANALCFGARTQSIEKICNYLETFIATDYEAGRHVKRLEKLDASVENKKKG